jgi:anthranilate synthase component 2
MILLVDNYDSFSYNLYQLIGSINPNIKVVRNDELTVEQIAQLAPEAIVLSPGPGRPADAGVCESIVRATADGRLTAPVLGVCLGHQAIVEALGGVVTYARELMHGKASEVELDAESRIFAGLGASAVVGRYHSLAASAADLPECLRVTAKAADGEIMAVEHMALPIFGVQFHPESILTPDGRQMVANFLGAQVTATHPLEPSAGE